MNIIHAVEALKQGHDVRRRGARFWLTPGNPWWFIPAVCEDGGEHVLDGTDLLADDWELVEDQP